MDRIFSLLGEQLADEARAAGPRPGGDALRGLSNRKSMFSGLADRIAENYEQELRRACAIEVEGRLVEDPIPRGEIER